MINAEYRALRHEEVASGRRSSEIRRCPAAWQCASADKSFQLYPHFLSSALLLCATSWPISWPCTLAVRLFGGVSFSFFCLSLMLICIFWLPALCLFPKNELSSSSEWKARRLGRRQRRREPSNFRPGRHVRRGFGEDAKVISERLFMRTSASKPVPDYK